MSLGFFGCCVVFFFIPMTVTTRLNVFLNCENNSSAVVPCSFQDVGNPSGRVTETASALLVSFSEDEIPDTDFVSEDEEAATNLIPPKDEADADSVLPVVEIVSGIATPG